MNHRYGRNYIAVLFACLIPSQATKEETLSMYARPSYNDNGSFYGLSDIAR